MTRQRLIIGVSGASVPQLAWAVLGALHASHAVDIDTARRQLQIAAPAPEAVSWGARLFQVRDPDGVPVTFIQWDDPGSEGP